MLPKKNNPSSADGSNLNRSHPFIKKIKAFPSVLNKQDLLKQVLDDLREKNYVFSNN